MSPSRNYPLRHCVWEITLACCFSCCYCGSRAGVARPDELSTEECLDVADQLAQLGCKRVSMIGGEVFLRRDWDIISSRLTSQGVAVNIITNGFTFTPELIDRLKSAKVESVSVSIDGTRELHDAFRQAGSHERALRAIQVLADAHIPVSIITTLNSQNVAQLSTMYECFAALPIYAWQLQACSPMGNAADCPIDWRFDFGTVLDFVAEHAPNAPFALGVADNIGYFTDDDSFLRGNTAGGKGFRGCSAGITGIGIDSVGNVRGCESMYDERFNEGNLRTRSLREIWEDPQTFAYNRAFTPDLLTGACASCEHGPFCAGGCRSYNHFAGGSLYESPACVQNNRHS